MAQNGYIGAVNRAQSLCLQCIKWPKRSLSLPLLISLLSLYLFIYLPQTKLQLTLITELDGERHSCSISPSGGTNYTFWMKIPTCFTSPTTWRPGIITSYRTCGFIKYQHTSLLTRDAWSHCITQITNLMPTEQLCVKYILFYTTMADPGFPE